MADNERKTMRFFLSAGEASGDIHGADLMRALRSESPGAEFTFLGGDLMAEAAGHEPLIHYRDMAYMGFSEVIRHLPAIGKNLKTARQAIEEQRPDAVILIDYPSFNLRLAKTAHRHGIPVFYYISPKVWAWKERRVKKIRRYCRRVLSILPFEVEFYRDRHGMEVTYVGNPSVAEVDSRLASLQPRDRFCRDLGLDATQPILALVPGSRKGELRNNLAIMMEVAARHPELQTVVAGAPGLDSEFYDELFGRIGRKLPVVFGHTFELMAHADVAMVTSGTATLECALVGTPQVVCYRSSGSRLTYAIMKRLLKIPYVSLPNLIAGSTVVPEQLIHLCTPERVDHELCKILPGKSGREAMLRGYDIVRQRLTNNRAAETAARTLLLDLQTTNC